MSTLRSTLSTTAVASLSLVWAACGLSPQPTTDALDQTLHQSYAALDEADEAPDFGDADIASAADLNGDEDVAVDDTVADGDADLAAAEADTEQPARRLMIAVLWGHLRPDFEAEQITDWSGVITAQNAGLRVVRTLAFDGADRLLPRQSLNRVPFTSNTRPSFDGLLLEVILHPRLVTDPEQPVTLRMITRAYTGELVLRQGMRLSHVERVDESGNAVAYHVFRRDADGCREGLLAGRYTAIAETEDGRALGQMRGRYMSFDGQVGGKIKGVYGERDNGNQVFFAKVINRAGEFIGTLAGRYGEGHLQGRYLTLGRVVAGALQGVYRAAADEDGGGFFVGRWSAGCGELSTEGEAEQSDEDNSAVDAELPDPEADPSAG